MCVLYRMPTSIVDVLIILLYMPLLLNIFTFCFHIIIRLLLSLVLYLVIFCFVLRCRYHSSSLSNVLTVTQTIHYHRSSSTIKYSTLHYLLWSTRLCGLRGPTYLLRFSEFKTDPCASMADCKIEKGSCRDVSNGDTGSSLRADDFHGI